MRTDASKATAVGLVIIVTLLLGALGILAVGREEGFFRDRVKFRTDFPNVDGLAEGAPVRLIGVQVGVVTDIRLPEERGKQEVDVVFAIDRGYADRIRVGTTATLKNLTYLSGEKYVELRPGDAAQPPIEIGGYIESPRSEVEQLIEGSKNIAANIEAISIEFRNLLDYLAKGDSLLSRLIQDPDFGKAEIAQASAAIAHINAVAGRIDAGRGLVGRLLTDDEFGESALRRFTQILDRMDGIAGKLEAGEGLMGRLLNEDPDLARAQDEFVELVASARNLMGRIDSGQGLVGRMLSDDEYGRTVTAKMDEILAAVSEVVARIDAGEGTLGKLINEPELYDQATDVVGGISDSRFLRWVARRVRNKHIKKQIKAYAEELEQAEKAGGEGP